VTAHDRALGGGGDLPKSLSYLKLVNLEFRGKRLDVVISRLPSGRVVRRAAFQTAGNPEER
jgi:hypothetical protein